MFCRWFLGYYVLGYVVKIIGFRKHPAGVRPCKDKNNMECGGWLKTFMTGQNYEHRNSRKNI
jgi:hypothetical protein